MTKTGYSTLSNFNPGLTIDKRVPKDFRIQRSSVSKHNSKTKTRPPLYSTQNSEHGHSESYGGSNTKQSSSSSSTIRKFQSKSQYLHNLADKSVAQVLSNHKVSPGNMYFASNNSKTSAADLEEELTRRLTEDGTEITSRTIKHASKTFEEVISQDVHFGNLLTKIKNAYETYISKKLGEWESQDDNKPSYQDLQNKSKKLENMFNSLQRDYLTSKKTEKELM